MQKTHKKRVEPAFSSAEVCKASNACARGQFYVVYYASIRQKTGRRFQQPVNLFRLWPISPAVFVGDERPVNRARRDLKIQIIHADDDVQFAGALVDQAHVHARLHQRVEQPRGNAL